MIKVIGAIVCLTVGIFANDLVDSTDKFAKVIFQSLQLNKKDLFVKTAIGSKEVYSYQIIMEEPRISKMPQNKQEEYIDKVLNYTLM